tara:strand:- start:358 stop:948 length:591 start_codon:yes stop_codon:yes gene_type:complete
MTIEEQSVKVNWKETKEIIDFYKSNKLYLDNYDLISDQRKISNLIDYKLHYCNALLETSELDQMTPILRHVSSLLSKLDKDHWNYNDSENLMNFLNGVILSQKKKYKESYSIFSELVKINPNNYNYRDWCNHARLGMYNWMFNSLSFFGAIVLVADILFGLEEKLLFDVGLIGVLILGASYIAQKGLNEYLKRKKG